MKGVQMLNPTGIFMPINCTDGLSVCLQSPDEQKFDILSQLLGTK